MIRRARFRASAFRGCAFSKKRDQSECRRRSKGDAQNSIVNSDHLVDRSTADMAIQHWLGLLSKRRARIDFADPDKSRRDWVALTEQMTG